MMSVMKKFLTYSIVCLLTSLSYSQTSIDQALQVITNDMTTGGNFQVQLRVKGTNLPSANTLGSATVDITFDNTKLTYVNSTNWAFGFVEGYNRSANDNGTFVRIFITGGGVNQNGGGDPPGFDINSSYASWVQLNFTIANASGATGLSIAPGSNAIGLFENYQNEPNTGVINNQPLSTPVEIVDEPLPVELTTFKAEIVRNKVNLYWETESEINNLGFEVWRSREEGGQYNMLSSYVDNPRLEGQGNSNLRHEYSYADNLVVNGQTYYYKVYDVDYNGVRTEHGPLTVTVEIGGLVAISGDIPADYDLHPNYPNPFNPSTTLRFDIPYLKNGTVNGKLIVYNSLGQKVRELYNGIMSSGSFEIEWDGTTSRNNDAPTGIYFARLVSDNYVKTIKMMLIR